MTLVAVSPHLDDAILSAGQVLLGHVNPIVLTVFAGHPADPAARNTYDIKCGYPDGADPVACRQVEDVEACRIICARPWHLDFKDAGYRDAAAPQALGMAARLCDTIERLRAGRVLAPLGISHPDHIATSNAALGAAIALGLPLWFYEELPYRVMDPEAAAARRDRLERAGNTLQADFIGTGPIETKEQAIACYRSQLWALDWHCLLVPERVWRVLW